MRGHPERSSRPLYCLRTAEVAVPKELFKQECNLDQLAGTMLRFSNVSHRSCGHVECSVETLLRSNR